MNQIFAAIISLAALLLRGFTGFGSSLVMMALLMLFLDVKTAVATTALTQVPVGFCLTFASRLAIDRSYLKVLLPPSILGILVGSFALVNFDGDLLKRVVGVITVVFALKIILALRQDSSPIKRWPASIGYLAGTLGGIFGGVFGTSGPPVIVFLEKQVNKKDVFRATLLAYFLAIDSLRLVSYAFYGLVNWRTVLISLTMIPSALIGAYLGARLNVGVSEHTFRLAVSALLLATGLLIAVD